jgi:hypothetical protein
MIKTTMTLTKENLCRQSAELSLGCLLPETMRASISSMMDQGFFSHNCLDILSNVKPSHDDVYATFLEMLAYCGIPIFSESDAVRVLAEYYLIPIANGEVDPASGLHQLMESVIWNYGFPNDQSYSCDSHGLALLYGIYYACDDLDPMLDASDIRWEDRKDMIVIHAKAWIKKYSPVRRSIE